MFVNLNLLEYLPRVKQDDNTAYSNNISVYFRDIEQRLIDHISEAEYIVGCVAWVTLPNILNALSRKNGTSLLIQKEIWKSKNGITPRWKHLATKIKGIRTDAFGEIEHFKYCEQVIFDSNSHLVSGHWTLDPIRCIGSHSDESKVHSRMHNKFIVFCKTLNHNDRPIAKNALLSPYAVWTGSFNFTPASVNSFENAIFIRDKVIAAAYCKEWAQLVPFSQGLDWTDKEPAGDIDLSIIGLYD